MTGLVQPQDRSSRPCPTPSRDSAGTSSSHHAHHQARSKHWLPNYLGISVRTTGSSGSCANAMQWPVLARVPRGC